MALDQTKFRVVNCGRQWGKTTLAVWEMISCAFAKNGRRIGYYATSFDQARDIAWALLKQLTQPIWASEPNESRLEIKIKTQDGGVSEISLKSWEAVEKARGTQFDLVILDEVAKMKNFKEGWQAVLLGTLAFRQGKALFISTPYGFNHFYDMHQLGVSNSDYKSWTFTSFDNPHLPKDYLYSIQQTVTPDYWNQEYLAQFTRFTGLIYREFDITKHVQGFEHIFNQHGTYQFGLDFAVRGFTACLMSYIDTTGTTYHLDEYKVEGDTAKNHARAIKDKLIKYAPFDKWTGYSDPAGWMKNQQKGDMLWSLADEYIEEGFPIIQANNEVVAGINYVRQRHAKDQIIVHPRCEKYIEEKLQYQWKDQSKSQTGMQSEPEEVRKIHDHLMDCERYEEFSKPPTPEEQRPELPYKAGMLLEFPHWSVTPDVERKNDNPNRDVFDIE